MFANRSKRYASTTAMVKVAVRQLDDDVALLRHKIGSQLTSTRHDYRVELNRIGNNINQLAAEVNRIKYTAGETLRGSTARQLATTLGLLKEMLEGIRKSDERLFEIYRGRRPAAV